MAAADRALADYAFGQLTGTLYDAIWGEYCDWALELAKVRLADETLSAADREATWWTLVEALDTYLRLLHPVMPFLTEAIWGQLPRGADDPPLLIVADWPAPGSEDPAAEADTAALLDLVRAIRNARSEAKIDPKAWLPVDVALPAASTAVFEELRPALERLARARPMRPTDDPAALHPTPAGGLAVVAGDLEAVVRPAAADPGAAGRDRARLEKELADTEAQLASARSRLADERFTSRAPAAVVEGARASAAELADRARAAPVPPGRLTRGAGRTAPSSTAWQVDLADVSASATAWRDRPLIGLRAIDPREVPCRWNS